MIKIDLVTPTPHDDVMKWKHFPHYWPFVWGIHRFPVNSPHKGQWHGALMFSLICARIKGWANDGEAGDLRCHRAHYDVIVMQNFDNIKQLTIMIENIPWNMLFYFVFLQVACGSYTYHKTCSISRTTSQNLNVSCILLQLSSLNPLKPGVKLRMKM